MSKATDSQRIAEALERIAKVLEDIWKFAQQERREQRGGR